MLSGAIGSSIASPTDLIKVRMQASTGVAYASLLHAVQSIVQVDGVAGLWRGVVPTVQRAAILTGAQAS
jgi:hypothetical protein